MSWRLIPAHDAVDLQAIHRASFMLLLTDRGHEPADWQSRADRWWPATATLKPRGASS